MQLAVVSKQSNFFVRRSVIICPLQFENVRVHCYHETSVTVLHARLGPVLFRSPAIQQGVWHKATKHNMPLLSQCAT